MPSTNTLIEDNRRVPMISVNGKVKVNPELCKHENVVNIHEGHEYTILGERDDNMTSYAQCLDCGAVKRDDGAWGMTLKVDDDKEIPF
jgi:hypothetical protein